MKDLHSHIVILLTATIRPNSRDILAVTDPEVRKQQYIQSINHYLTNTHFKIVFVENSGNSLSQIFTSNPRLEFLTFSSPFIEPDKGKGYKELEIIEYAMNNSRLISRANFIIKITGRLKVLNINRVHKKIFNPKESPDKIVLSNVYKESKMDSRCFCFSKDFWPTLRRHGENIDLSFSFERALWRAISEYNGMNPGHYRQFSQPLRIQGVSGGLGTSYKHGTIIDLGKKIRHYFNKWKYASYFNN